MPFICGSFGSQEKEKHGTFWPFSSTSTRRHRVFGSRINKNATNPYADRGLDKFEALVADLDRKRHKILTEIRSEDATLVKFIYISSNELKPIVIRLHDRKQHHDTSSLRNNAGIETKEENTKQVFGDHIEKIRSDIKIGEWLKPCYCFPLFVILILVMLMFSGRSFVILCTSIGWYLVPIVNKTVHKLNQRC
ncbi:hypothetical protein R6Q57_021097 [Mikania cordata]